MIPPPHQFDWMRGQATQALQRADCEAQPLLKLRLESTIKHHTGMIVIIYKNANALLSFHQFIMIERRI
jgi:hypothetical protein